MHRFRLGLFLVVLVALVAPAARAVAVSAVPAQVAFTRHFNIYLMNSDGTNPRTITTRGTGYQGTYYGWYAWSPSGKYLLAVRNEPGPGQRRRQHLLLLYATGKLVRDLAILPESADFYPAWALDGDQIAYVAWEKWPKGASAPYNAVDEVDVTGKTSFLWGYRSTGEGCGGGTSDPAESTYWEETGFGGVPASLQWSMARHQAIYSASCAGGLFLTDTRTRATRPLGRQHEVWNEAAISRTGTLAAVASTCGGVTCARRIVLVNLHSGAIIRSIAGGELPLWSSDGHILYFVKRTPGKVLHMQDPAGNKVDLQTQTSQIWRANGDGSQPLRLLSEDAYGLGTLNLTPEGRAIIFSRVDNDWGLWQHRLPGNRFNQAIIGQYGPKVRIERFDSGHLPVTIAADAGRPVIQP